MLPSGEGLVIVMLSLYFSGASNKECSHFSEASPDKNDFRLTGPDHFLCFALMVMIMMGQSAYLHPHVTHL